MKICIVIPVFNEARKISSLINELKIQGLEVLIVDDGSEDNSQQAALAAGAVVIRNEKNLGKGASLSRGFDYALANNFDAVITMDGDGQHLPQDLASFIKLAQDSDAGIIVGNRMGQVNNMPFLRLAVNKFMSWLISCVAKQKIADSQCGFRLIRKEVLQKVKLKTVKFEAESEILLEAARLGFKIASTPVKTIYCDEKSKINPFIDTFRFIRFIAKEALRF